MKKKSYGTILFRWEKSKQTRMISSCYYLVFCDVCDEKVHDREKLRFAVFFFSKQKQQKKHTQISADYISCPPPSHTYPPNLFVRKKRLSALCKSKLWKNKTMCMICTCRHILSPPREWKLKNLEKMWLRTEDSCQFFVPFKKIFNIFYVIKGYMFCEE